jgi:hypothetical protein
MYVQSKLIYLYTQTISLLCPQEPIVAKDNISEITEGRKSLFFALTFLMFAAFLPYDDIVSGIEGTFRYLFTMQPTNSGGGLFQ